MWKRLFPDCRIESRGESVHVRTLEPEHYEEISRMSETWMPAVLYEATLFSAHGYADFLRASLAIPPSRFTSHFIGIYTNANSLIGFAEWRLIDDILFLNNFYVSALFRGRGIGSHVIRQASIHAAKEGLSSVQLDAFDTNESAIRLYERNGFVRQHAYYWYASAPLHQWMDVEAEESSLDYMIHDWPQAVASLEVYGYGFFRVSFDRQEERIVLMKENYFRMRLKAAMNKDVLALLARLAPHRRVLVSDGGEEPPHSGMEQLAVAFRMVKPLS